MTEALATRLISTESAETLRRCSSDPDVDGGAFDHKRDARLYLPLVGLGLLERTIRPCPADDEMEVVHYETTTLGRKVLASYDRLKARPA